MAGYGDDAGFEAWLIDNGHAVPEGVVPVAALRQRGSAYIDGLYGPRFSGLPTGGFTQERAWPRTGATAHGQSIPDTLVPAAIIQASYAAALHEATSPGALSATASAAGVIKREKVDVLEVEYAAGSGDALKDATPMLLAVEGLLAPFLSQPMPAVFVV